MEINTLLKQLEFLESQVAKMESKLKLYEVYRSMNDKLILIIRLLIISQIIIVLLLVILAAN